MRNWEVKSLSVYLEMMDVSLSGYPLFSADFWISGFNDLLVFLDICVIYLLKVLNFTTWTSFLLPPGVFSVLSMESSVLIESECSLCESIISSMCNDEFFPPAISFLLSLADFFCWPNFLDICLTKGELKFCSGNLYGILGVLPVGPLPEKLVFYIFPSTCS